MTKSATLPVTGGQIRRTVNAFLKDLFEKDVVEAMLVPLALPAGNNVVPTLITEPEYLNDADIFAPVFPVLTSSIMQDMTRLGSSNKKLAVIIRPCDMRALIDLIKLKQAALDNVLLVSFDCPGAYPIATYAEYVSGGNSDDFLKKAFGETDEKLRSGCKICAFPTPLTADIAIGSIGLDPNSGLLLQADSPAGEEALTALGLTLEDNSEPAKKREAAVSDLLSKMEGVREKFFEQTREEIGGIEKLSEVFATCIKCHNCKTICPVCYCRECFFDSPTFDLEASKYLGMAEKRGAMRMPADTLLFHLTRMTHMAASCIGCGACEEVCPSKIPLLKIFQMTGDEVQRLFDYVPGRSLTEELPMATFREEELDWIGEQ